MNKRNSAVLRRLVVLACVPVLVLTSGSVPVFAAAAKPFRPPAPQKIPPVATRDVKLSAVAASDPAALAAAHRPPAPVWPAGGTAEVALTMAVPGLVRAGALPVRLGAGSSSPGTAKVTVFSRAQAKTAGVDGVLARVEGSGPGSVRVAVDYGSFASAYGGDWSTRLRLVQLPDCALSTPDRGECRSKPLATRNDISAQTLTATVQVGSLVATESASSGGAGDYTATKLQASSTWSAGANSGAFTWSYPMTVPPSVGGPAPDISLSYNSQSVDGQMAANNNQPSWTGAGFELAPGGFIERRYKPCADDMTGGNNSVKTGDLCWATDNATLALDGHSGELLFNSSENRWHLRGDDGSRIERRTSPGNGDNDNEYWVVTTTNGTQYWFGRNRLPGWSSGQPETKSVWTEPVFGNHTGEPCNAGTFAASSCTQAWRWNLDYVIDMNANTMSFWYDTATNKYAKNQALSSPVDYIRDGWLTRIDYGTRSSKDLAVDPGQTTSADSVFTAPAPMSVDFLTDDRCLSGCATHDQAHWTDVPWDQECTGSPCYISSPTFWSTKRLKQVVTKIRDGSSYRVVQTWTLTHIYPNPGDGTRAPLWLSKLGHAGGTDTVPDVEFIGVQKNNRVDPVTLDGRPPMNWWRISQIKAETGGTISVTYSDADCIAPTRLPDITNLAENHFRCYPVKWTPTGAGNPIQEFFHKYVVTEIREKDNTGGTPPFGSPEVLSTYSYPTDGAAWHYTDEDGLIKDENKTWSVWRGYATVTSSVGDAGQGDTPTKTVTTFFRGMHGDKAGSGMRDVDMPAIDMNGNGSTADAVDAPALKDSDAFAGLTRMSSVYNGQSGAEVFSTVTTPWKSTASTASRTINNVTVEAWMTGTEESRTRVALDHSPWWRTTSTKSYYDSAGRVEKSDDFGDDAVATDNQCTVNAYKPNDTAWLRMTVKEVTTFAKKCSDVANPNTLTEDDVISNVRTAYDGLVWDAAPTKGMVTQVAKAWAWNAGVPTDQAVTTTAYDAQGRVTSSTDAMGRTTTTAYTPASGGPLTQTVVTQPAPFFFTATTVNDPAFGVPLSTIDLNGKRTELRYDGIGRLTGVWLPGRVPVTNAANLIFSYLVRDNGPTVVTSKTLNAVDDYTTTYAFYDGLMRQRQSQALSPSGGRIVTDAFYDSAGRSKRTYGAYFDNRGGPGTTLVVPLDRHDVADQTYTVYDGAGRTTDVVFDPYNNGERWRTHTAYGGDRTDVTPPNGGVRASTFTDGRGNTTALWQYGYPTAGDHVTTTYQYNVKDQLSKITDTAGNYWSNTYYLSGLVKTRRDPDAGTTTFEYDKNGNVTAKIDAANQKLVYDYDELNRKRGLYITSKTTANKRATWIYDTAVFDGTSMPVKGQLAESIRWTNSGLRAYKSSVVKFNDRYRPTVSAVTIPSAETGLSGTYTFQNSYRVNGSPETSTLPATSDLPAEGVTVNYDPTTGLPYGLDTILGTSEFSLVSGTTYDALARISQLTYYTGRYSQTGAKAWIAYQRELDTGRLTNITTSRQTGTPSVVTNQNFTYDPAGNIMSITESAAGDNQCFKYDALRRLEWAWTPSTTSCGAPDTQTLGGPAPYRNRWTFDAVGNRTQQVEYPTPVNGTTRTTGYTYPAAQQNQPHTVTASTGAKVGAYQYDALGNTTCRPYAANNVCGATPSNSQILGWDVEGHLASSTDSTGSTTYLYDAEGNRLIRTDPTGKTLYLPGQEIRYTTSSGATATTRYYSFAGNTVGSRTATGLTWLSADHQGTANASIDQATQAVVVRRQSPYGEARGNAPAWPNTKGFVGGTNDNTGLTHLGAREYDPALGRFISVDPLLDAIDPQSMTNYGYADSNAVTSADPTGFKTEWDEERRIDAGKVLGEAARNARRTRTGGRGGSSGCFGGDRQSGACLPGNGGARPGEPSGCFGGDRQTGACLPGNGGTGPGKPGGCFGGDRQTGTCLTGNGGTGPKSAPGNEAGPTDGPEIQTNQTCLVARVGLVVVGFGADICYGYSRTHGDYFTITTISDMDPDPHKGFEIGSIIGVGHKTSPYDPTHLVGKGKTDEEYASHKRRIGLGQQTTTYDNGGLQSSEELWGAGGYYEDLEDADTTTCFYASHNSGCS
jgi:RHS repeat-associated protein